MQEKQKTKVKEKFDKCNKEKLLEFCDVLDIPIAKANRRKVCHKLSLDLDSHLAKNEFIVNVTLTVI